MFNFKDGKFAYHQQEQADKLLIKIKGSFSVNYSNAIDLLFQETNFNNIDWLCNMMDFAKLKSEKFDIILGKHNHYFSHLHRDINNSLSRSKIDSPYQLPYISWSFSNSYELSHWYPWQHVYMFFVTKHANFIDAEDYMLDIINKFYILESFI